MTYVSTRDTSEVPRSIPSAEAIKNGIAPDGGLYMPETIPTLSEDDITRLCELDYAGRAAMILSMFLCSKVIDFVLYGAATSKMCYIISDKSERVKNDIVSHLNRGVTVIHGEGAYSGKEKQVLLCVVKRQQVMDLRTIVQASDEKAFLIFTDARDVYGEGFMNLYSTE